MHLILLHGAIGSSKQFDLLRPLLETHFTVHVLNFFGHGGADAFEPLSIEGFARQVLDYIDENIMAVEGPQPPVSVFGYSMGGYVAMYLARYYGGRLQKIVTLATKFHWDPETAERETKMLQPDIIEAKLPAFAQKLSNEHSPAKWKEVLRSTAVMLSQMGDHNPIKSGDYSLIANECLLLLGDRDKMVPLRETQKVFESLPNAQLAVLPATPHPFEKVDVMLLAFVLRRFLGQ